MARSSPLGTPASPTGAGRASEALAVHAALLFAVVAWGGSFVAARMVLYPGSAGAAVLTPTMLAMVRFLLASAVFVPILYRQQRRAHPLKLADVPTFLLLGQLAFSVYFWLQYTGVRLTNAGVASVLVVGLIPLATALVSGLALGETFGARKALALALGGAGVALVASQRSLEVAVESGFLVGTLCLLANALCFGVYSTLVRGIRGRYSPLTITAATMVAGTLGLVLLSLAADDWRALGSLSVEQWGAVVYLAAICSVAAYFLYNHALSRVEASRAAIWLYLEPPVAVVLGALLLGEVIAVQTVAGGLVILASLYLMQRPASR